ncbi:hypothetical protein BJV77DRAFT_753870 [Russula vinacea]|nr:hypothetical protein BJV77DRAFT_753870 [Russula vinacea]
MVEQTDADAIKSDSESELSDLFSDIDECLKSSSPGTVHRGVKPDAETGPKPSYRCHPLIHVEHRSRVSEDSESMETDDDEDADARWVVVKRENTMRLDKNGRIMPHTNGDAVNEAVDMPAPPPDVMHGKTPLGQVVKSRRRKAHNFELSGTSQPLSVHISQGSGKDQLTRSLPRVSAPINNGRQKLASFIHLLEK